MGPAPGWLAFVSGLVNRALESVVGGSRSDLLPPMNGLGVTSRGLRTTTGLAAFAPVCGLLTAAGLCASVRVPMFAWGGRRDRSRSRGPHRRSRDRSLLSCDRSRSRGRSWRSRLVLRERVETVAVSQAPVVSKVSAAVAPPVERVAASAFLPSVQDLARFFLSLTGSSSQGVVVGDAGVTVSASGARVQLCPSAPGGEAATFGTASTATSLAAGPPSGVASVPGSSGRRSCAKESSR